LIAFALAMLPLLLGMSCIGQCLYLVNHAVMDDYKKLLEKAKELMVWSGTSGLIQWDFETYMPKGGTEQRSMQMAALEQLIHEKTVDPGIGKLLVSVKSSPKFKDASDVERRNIHLIQKTYDEQTKLPADLVEKIAKEYAIAVDTWKRAKAAKKFAMFKPELEKTIDLIKQKAHYLDPSKPAYDVLVDLFEPGITVKQIAAVFEPLKKGLIPIIRKCVHQPTRPHRRAAKDIGQAHGLREVRHVPWTPRRDRTPVHGWHVRRRAHLHALPREKLPFLALCCAARGRPRSVRAERAS
jgi:Zn-dependent M32 family carboxypeptidase